MAHNKQSLCSAPDYQVDMKKERRVGLVFWPKTNGSSALIVLSCEICTDAAALRASQAKG